MREGYNHEGFTKNGINFDPDGSIDINKNRSVRELSTAELRSKIPGEVASYIADAKVAKSRGDVEMISDNMANYIGISYWDGASEEKKQDLEHIIKGIPGLDAVQSQMVFAVVRKLKSRNDIQVTDYEEAA